MSGDDSPTDDSTFDSKRRKLLAALGTGAAAGVAGCGGGGGGDSGGQSPTGTATATPTEIMQPGEGGTPTPTETPGEDTPSPTATPKALPKTNRTYKSFFGAQLAKINWDVFNYREDWPRSVNHAAFAFKASTNQQTGNIMGMLVQDWSISPKQLKFQFRPKEEWPMWYKGIPSEDGADGLLGPVRPSDWAIPEQLGRWSGRSPKTIKNSKRGMPRNWWEAITDVTWDDDAGTVTFHSEPGWFDDFRISGAISELLTAVGGRINTGRKFVVKVDHEYPPRGAPIDTYKQVKDMSWEKRRKQLTSSGPSTPEPLEYSPKEIPTSGLFTVTDVTEQHVMMEAPSYYVDEHVHYNGDKINWPKQKLFSMPSANLRNKALVEGRLDGINGGWTPKSTVISQLPKRYKTHLHNKSATSGFSLNASRVKWFADPRVRQAVLLALKKEPLANTLHRFAATPPESPPGLIAPSYRKLVPDDLQSAYDTYSRNLKRANQLMRKAGFSKKGGTWRTPEGKKFQVNLLTTTQSVQVPALAMQQLKNWGIDMALVTNSPSTTEARVGRGDYEMTTQGWWIWHVGLWTRAIQQSNRRHKFGMISDKAVKNFVNKYKDEGVKNVEYDWTNNLENVAPEMWKYFTLPMPKVGNRDYDVPPITEWNKQNGMWKAPSGWTDIPVFYYAHTWGAVTSDDKAREWMKKLTWATNFYLPYTPYAISAQLAVQDHGQWDAPTDSESWMQDEPVNKLMAQGKISANPKE